MSHFTVMVVGSIPEDLLAKFDETIDVPQYVRYTKEELIAKEKQAIEDYKNGRYAEYLKDKETYKADCLNPQHIEYLENEFPKRLTWTDEEIYAEIIKGYEEDEIGANGEVYSTYNPDSKWDWYTLGGRWSGLLKTKDEQTTDVAIKSEILNFDEVVTFALLDANGNWHERGDMGWWGVVSNEDDSWEEKLKELKALIPDDELVSIYDCHI